MTNLVIVESGAKGKKIKQYLGKNYIVDTCKGHVQDLPGRGAKDKKQANKAMWASKPDVLPEPPWDWSGPNAERTVESLLSKAEKNKVETIYIATDPDREGEFIAWRLAQIFENYDTVRITFNEITKKAVLQAIDSPRPIDMDLVDAAKVRRFMDRLVGFRASKFSRSWRLPSMGRVQTPTLGFIVERELEREAFIPQPYYAVTSNAGELTFKVRFHEKNDPNAWFDQDTNPPKHHPDRTNDLTLATTAVDAIKENGKLTLTEVKPGTRSNSPKPPFSTPTLLRTAGSHPRIGWGSRRIMSVANDLYQQGLITYIRTDATRTSPEAREAVREHISQKWGSNHLRDTPGVVGKDASGGAKNVQDAHEAIRPTDPTVESPEGIDDAQLVLYRLIWARFAASQMSNSEYQNLSLRAKAGNFECPLTGSVSWRVHAGWEAAYGDLRSEPLLSAPKPELTTGTLLQIASEENNGWRLIEDETKPPARFRQHTLVEKMQNEGIGRPSTYAKIVETLLNRKYLIEESKALIPTEAGRTLWLEVAPMYGSDESVRGVFESHFTATMESGLDSIEHGSGNAPTVWHDFMNEFSDSHKHALELRSMKPTPKQLNYMVNLLNAIPESERLVLLDGNEPDQISGSRAKEIIDELRSRDIIVGPSEKQMALITRLIEELGIASDDAAKLVEETNLESLSGGRNGSASKLIGLLLDLQKEKPRAPTERQMKYLNDLLGKGVEGLEGFEIPLFLEQYSVPNVEEMSFAQISDAIQIMKDRLGIKGRGRGRKR